MRAVRVGKVAGGVYLVRLYLLNQVGHQRIVVFAQRLFLHQTRFIKRHIQKVQVFHGDAHKTAGGLGFGLADQFLDVAHGIGVFLA